MASPSVVGNAQCLRLFRAFAIRFCLLIASEAHSVTIDAKNVLRRPVENQSTSFSYWRVTMSTPQTRASKEDLNPFRIASQQFEHAVAYLPHLKAGLIDMLKRSSRTITLELP